MMQTHAATMYRCIGKAMRYAQRSLVAQAFGLIILFILPLLVLIFLIIRTLSATSEDAQKRFLSYTATAIANGVDTELQRYLTMGEMLAASEHLSSGDLGKFVEQARAMLGSTGVAVVLHSDGLQVLNTAFPHERPLPKRSEEGYRTQLRAAQSGRTLVSNVYVGALQKRWLATVEIPAATTAGGRYALTVVFPLDRFHRLLSTTEAAPHWFLGIADGAGRFVAGFPGARAAGNEISPDWKARLRQPGLAEFRTLEGYLVVNANALVGLADWTVGVAVRRDSLDAAVQSSFRWAAVAALLIFAGLGTVGIVFVYRLSAGFRALQVGLLDRLRGRPVAQLTVPAEFAHVWQGVGAAADERHRVTRMLEVTLRDVRDAQAKVRQSTDILQAISALSPDLLYAKDHDGKLLFASRSLATLVDKPLEDLLGKDETFFLSAANEIARIKDNDRRVLAGESLSDEEPVTRPDGTQRVFLSNKLPWRNEHGHIIGLLGISVDITERRRHEERMQYVMREVNHRAKNMLSVVQAVARSSSRTAITPTEFLERFNARLHSLAQSMDLLVFNEWRGVDLEALVRAQLEHFAAEFGTRIHWAGPPFMVSPSAAQSLGMAVHELATNASKYGALSGDVGEVEIAWRVTGDQFYFHWIECDGPTVTAPKRGGFGSTVLTTLLTSSFACEPRLRFEARGLSWTLTCALDDVVSVEPPLPVDNND